MPIPQQLRGQPTNVLQLLLLRPESCLPAMREEWPGESHATLHPYAPMGDPQTEGEGVQPPVLTRQFLFAVHTPALPQITCQPLPLGNRPSTAHNIIILKSP